MPIFSSTAVRPSMPEGMTLFKMDGALPTPRGVSDSQSMLQSAAEKAPGFIMRTLRMGFRILMNVMERLVAAFKEVFVGNVLYISKLQQKITWLTVVEKNIALVKQDLESESHNPREVQRYMNQIFDISLYFELGIKEVPKHWGLYFGIGSTKEADTLWKKVKKSTAETRSKLTQLVTKNRTQFIDGADTVIKGTGQRRKNLQQLLEFYKEVDGVSCDIERRNELFGDLNPEVTYFIGLSAYNMLLSRLKSQGGHDLTDANGHPFQVGMDEFMSGNTSLELSKEILQLTILTYARQPILFDVSKEWSKLAF